MSAYSEKANVIAVSAHARGCHGGCVSRIRYEGIYTSLAVEKKFYKSTIRMGYQSIQAMAL